MNVASWDDMKIKYPEYRDEMSEERELQFVSDCFDLYEREGFAKKFWSQGSDFSFYHGQPFKVLGRTPLCRDGKPGADLDSLPMWRIQFDDGFKMDAYPDEIIPREMRANGCRLEGIE